MGYNGNTTTVLSLRTQLKDIATRVTQIERKINYGIYFLFNYLIFLFNYFLFNYFYLII